MALTLRDLESRLWSAANALRGPVDPADFKTYVFPILFWKWISDSWTWERTRAVDEYGDDVPAEVEADYHRFDLPQGAHWRDVTAKTANLGAHIATALARIERANPDTLAGVFGDAAWGNKERLPEASLINLIDAFNGLTLDPDHVSHDLLGQGYEYLLKNFADESGRKAGEFFTPRSVVRLLIRILDPKDGESVYDPACGSGGMLVETITTVSDHGGDTRTLRLYGQEVNLTTSAIARMNLFLHEIEDFRIVRGDTLRSPGLRGQDGRISRFDVVVANPPFSLANWGAETWAADPRAAFGVPPARYADWAWVQHMIASMNDNGRAGVILPLGALSRLGAESSIRTRLIVRDILEAVIVLPENLFYNTDIAVAILVFAAPARRKRAGEIVLVDAQGQYTKGVNQHTLSEANISDIVAGVTTPGAARPGVSARVVTISDVLALGGNLHLGRYMSMSDVASLDLQSAISDFHRERSSRATAESAFLEMLNTLSIGKE